MKFTDIISLARSGFTPADIREFLAQDTEQTPDKPPEDKPDDKSTANGGDTTSDLSGQKEEPTTTGADNVDYEAKIRDLNIKIEELTKSLQTAQQQNIKTDASGKKEDPLDILKATMADFM